MSDTTSAAPPTCDLGNDYDGNDLGLRVSTIFVIFVGSLLGGVFPIIARRSKGKSLMPPVVFFIAKYFGSGVIVATAFIHLLAPANEALKNECLTGPITDYDWPEGIALMMIFVLFFVELVIMRSGVFENHNHGEAGDGNENSHYHDNNEDEIARSKEAGTGVDSVTGPSFRRPTESSITTPNRGEDHLGHTREHLEVQDGGANATEQGNALADGDMHEHTHVHGTYDDYAAQMTAIFILEFGVIFHSIFIGLTLAVTSPDELPVLYVVLVFHQTFEGLGLGTRLAISPWPRTARGRWTPYLLALGYALSTPVAIAIGLGVRETYSPGSQTALITSGVFDSISAGILIYTGLVELMAHEFMFSETMRRASTPVMLSAFGVMCLGAGLMALLGKWA